MTAQSVLWRRLDQPGHESARLTFHDSCWRLTGSAVFSESQRPCRLDYLVLCNPVWETLLGEVSGWIGHQTVEIQISVDSDRRWRLNGTECPAVAGCIDLDLSFSPSTNLLPIRRLNLAIGQETEVRAAWLRFPDFALEPLAQFYRRIDARAYRYEGPGGEFVTELEVNAAGFVTRCPGFWQMESTI